MRSIFSYFRNFKSDKNNLFVTQPNNSIYVAISKIHGRGVFAQHAIKSGAIIEECPIIKMKLQEMTVRKNMLLNYYAFMIDQENEYTGISLGYGSLYNHSNPCNAIFYFDKERELMIFEAIRHISKHEEITINYLGTESSDHSIENWLNKPEI